MPDRAQPTASRASHGIRITPVGPLDPAVPAFLREPLAEVFGAEVQLSDPLPLREPWYDPRRGQYRGDYALDALVRTCAARPGWTLGIADADLFVPGLTFIFGQATVGGCCGIIGLARLRPGFYGLPHDEDQFRRRTLIEAVHELGHVAGLDHCPDPHCVMHFSNTIEDTDRKGPVFCARCECEIRRLLAAPH